eukprot:1157711-Pelagomonas_calceolata.AAC.20
MVDTSHTIAHHRASARVSSATTWGVRAGWAQILIPRSRSREHTTRPRMQFRSQKVGWLTPVRECRGFCTLHAYMIIVRASSMHVDALQPLI